MAEEAAYIALKRMQVHELDSDGSPRLDGEGRPVMRHCLPGDPIPEATSWSNLWREVRAGRVGLAGTALSGPALADSMRRKIADSAGRSKAERKSRTPKRERPRSREPVPPEPEPKPEGPPNEEVSKGGETREKPEAEPEQPIADVAPRSAGAEADPEQE